MNYECISCNDWFESITHMKIHHAQMHDGKVGILSGDERKELEAITWKCRYCKEEVLKRNLSREDHDCPSLEQNEQKQNNSRYPDDKEWNRLRKEIIQRDNGNCQECKEDGNHVHHIEPLSKGGSNKKENLILLCKDCHKSKHPEKNMSIFA